MRLRDLFRRDRSVYLSDRWIQQQQSKCVTEFEGVCWQFPVQKLRNETSWRQTERLKKRA